MNKGIRYQLVPRSAGKGSKVGETKVIVVAEESYELPADIISSIINKSTWAEKYSLPFEYAQYFKDQYVYLLKVLLAKIDNQDNCNLKATIIKYSREVMNGSFEHLSSRYLRRRMVGRLISLIIDFDPIREILSDMQVRGITLSGRNCFRVHYVNGSITNLNWFVVEDEAKLLKMVLSKFLVDSKVDIKLSDNLEASISSLRINDFNEGSLIISPKRARKRSMLDLIKAKVLSPQLARNISQSMLSLEKGFLISGGLDSGKSGLLSAVISSVSTNSAPLIIADNKELKACHPHAEILSHAEISDLLANTSNRFLEDSISRMGARHVFVDDLSPALYLFLLRLRLVYDIPIVATIPSINPKNFLKYLLEDVRLLKNLNNNEVDEVEVTNLLDAFPFIISLSKERDLRGISCIYETSAAGKNFHLVPIVRRQFEDTEITWELTDLASSESLISFGYGL